MDTAEILARDLGASLPPGLRALLRPDERAVIIIPGYPSTIAATNQRVLVSERRGQVGPTAYRYSELTGIGGSFEVVGRKYVALAGPGLNDKPGISELGRMPNATLVQVWRLGQARTAVDELNGLIAEMHEHPPETDPPLVLSGPLAANDAVAIRPEHFVASFPGYSRWGQIITFGTLPAFAAVVLLLPGSPVDVSVASRIGALVVGLIPGAVWLIAKARGPYRPFGWFYRPPADVTFDEAGISWRRWTGQRGPIPWDAVAEVRRSRLSGLSLRDAGGRRLVYVPSELRSVQTLDRVHQATFAMALVVSRLDRYVLVESSREREARLRQPAEPESRVVPQPPQKVDPTARAVVGIVVVIFVSSFVRGLALAPTSILAPSPTLPPVAAWVPVASSTGHFVIRMPGAAVTTPTTVAASAGASVQLDVTEWDSPDRYTSFGVVYTPIPSSVPVTDQAATLLKVEQGAVSGAQATIGASTSSTFEGFASVEFTATTTSGPFRELAFLDGDRLYQLIVVGRGISDATVEAFFQSFQLTG